MRCTVGSRAGAAAVVVFAALPAACTSTPAPARTTPATSVSSTSSPSSSRTSSASPTSFATSGPPTSTQALTPLQKEAIAAVESFYAEFNSASETRSSSRLRKLYAPGCAPCELLASRIDGLRTNDQSVEGSSTSPFDLTAMDGTKAGIGVQGAIHSAAVKIRDASGEVVNSFPEETKRPVVWLLRAEATHLVVTDIKADP